MRHIYRPIVGSWYKSHDMDEPFEVVATDEQGCVEVQYFSGEIEEYDIEVWNEFDLLRIPPPEDVLGPFEYSREDLGYNDHLFRREFWSGALTELEPEDYY